MGRLNIIKIEYIILSDIRKLIFGLTKSIYPIYCVKVP